MFSAVPDSRDMLFIWQPPNSTLRNGLITSYSVTCFIQGTGTGQISSVYLPQESYRLSGFRPATQYNCRAVAVNSAGSGPPAEITLISPEDGNHYTYIGLPTPNSQPSYRQALHYAWFI